MIRISLGSRLRVLVVLSAGVLLGIPSVLRAQQQAGTISGRTINQDTGLPVFGSSVTVLELGIVATSDLTGAYQLEDVPAGVHSLVVVKDGFTVATITEVNVTAGDVTQLDIPMQSESLASDVLKMEAFSVSASVVQSSDIGLLIGRQKAAAVSDAISSDQFSRLGVGDAAEAMSKVTGASIVDDKYVLIRGLGDRYSNTLLNNVSVPSADPDKRAVQMDQFPADLIESITTTKSFTPDQPGAFSGGSVNVKTKSFPERFFFSVGADTSFNTATTGSDILVVPGGGRDWLGMDDGTRALPHIEGTIPNATEARLAVKFGGDFTLANALDAATKAFHNENYYPSTRKARPDFGVNFAIGDRITFGSEGQRIFGYTASLTYGRSTSHYEDGEAGEFSGSASSVQINRIYSSNRSLLTFGDETLPAGTPALGVTSSTESVDWGAFVKLALRPVDNHEFSLDLLHNQSADDLVKRGVGEDQRNEAGAIYEAYDIRYTERAIDSAQFAGKSLLPSLSDTEIDWRLAYSLSTQDQPDYRTLSAIYNPDGTDANAVGILPDRYFRALEEDSIEGGIDVTVPFVWGEGNDAKVKFGGMMLKGNREYSESRFQWATSPSTRAALESFPTNIGIIDQTPTSVSFGNVITQSINPNNYTAEQTITGAYLMLDTPIVRRWRAIVGFRFEGTDLLTEPIGAKNSNPRDGVIDQVDFLPATSLVYAQTNNMNWRLAYGRTIARPTFKELTDVRYNDVFLGRTFLGNPDLELSLIDNFDLRWEWFPRKGETMAVSLFYKKMTRPIEVENNPTVGADRPVNAEEATVAGVEFEFRRGLGFLGEAWDALSLGANLTLIESEVPISEEELVRIRMDDPDAGDTRELYGQSPYVFNFDISYDRRESGTGVTLSYNIVGERLDLVNRGSLADVYEQPAPSLNFVLSQRLSDHWRLKFSAKNLLNSAREKTIAADGGDLIYERYKKGRTFGLSVSYLFE